MPAVINRFEGKYRFLSNFSSSPLVYGGRTYLNAEAAFQAQKCPERSVEFCRLNPTDAKHLGRKVRLRPDWEKVKDGIMCDILMCKFSQDPDLRQKLLDTGHAELEEGNTWGDKYWGTVDGVGKNKLGKLLMEVRENLSSESQ